MILLYISSYLFTFPYLSSNKNLYLYSDSYENISTICNFLIELQNSNLNIRFSFPKIESEIKSLAENFYLVNLCKCRQYWTAHTQWEFCTEYLRHYFYFAKNYHISLKFYIPKIPIKENDYDFLFHTTCSNLLIPIHISKSTEYPNMLKLLENLIGIMNIKELSHTKLLLRIYCKKYYFDNSMGRIFDQYELLVKIYQNNLCSDVTLILSYFENLFNIKVKIEKSYFITVEYKKNIFYLKYCFSIIKNNEYFLVYISKYDNDHYGIFCKVGKYIFALNELAIEHSYMIKAILFSLYAKKIIWCEKIYKDIKGISFTLSLTKKLSIEYFFLPEDCSLVISNLIFHSSFNFLSPE